MISILRVTKKYPNSDISAVDAVSLEIQDGEIFILLGSSGSGKTTLLKMINLLIKPDQGDITIDGKSVNEYDPIKLRHSIGYVFQQTGLFPHLTIEENISIPLKILGKTKSFRHQRTKELMELVHLDSKQLSKRYPNELSGGQQQRVGVARALAANPKYLLMDEPFAALDAITRQHLQNQLKELNQQLHKTIIFVTHDIQEACFLADRIGVMQKGKLIQVGATDELLHNPANAFVAQLFEGEKKRD